MGIIQNGETDSPITLKVQIEIIVNAISILVTERLNCSLNRKLRQNIDVLEALSANHPNLESSLVEEILHRIEDSDLWITLQSKVSMISNERSSWELWTSRINFADGTVSECLGDYRILDWMESHADENGQIKQEDSEVKLKLCVG